MRSILAVSAVLLIACGPAFAGEAEVKAAQGAIDGQLKAFAAGDNAAAYDYAAPTIKRIWPTLESFMGMVTGAYQPVYKPQNYIFGEAEETGASVTQQVLIVGPDGKDYEAVYTVQLQPDGVWRITGVNLRASTALSV